MLSLGLCALLVEDYDEAIEYYTGRLGFHLVQDTELGGDKRWVVVAPSLSAGAMILLARAADVEQRSRIGGQTGGRVGWFLYTDAFVREHARLRDAGVVFEEEPREEDYGTVAVFLDLYGNRWDLIQPS